MKTINKFVLILFTSISVLLSSCSKSDSGGSSIPATGSYIQANVAGSDFQSSGDFISGTFTSTALNISGASTTGKSINIQLYPLSGATLTTGTYNINSTSADSGGLTFIDVNTSTFSVVTYSSVNCDNSVGTLEITYIDANKVEGTFSCTAKEVKEDESCNGGTKNITNGSFRLLLN